VFGFSKLSEAQKRGSAARSGVPNYKFGTQRPILGRERRPALPAGAKNGRFEKSNTAKLKNRHIRMDINSAVDFNLFLN
jgi:hypothetical protein